jgi:membrane protease YdiL (CAAX protease family)
MPPVFQRLVVFFGLACAFTWMGWLGNALWPSDYWLLPMNPFGPLMAAPIAILLMDGVAGLKAWAKRLANFRAPLWVYGAALLGPLAIILASVGLAAFTGASIQPLPELAFLDFVLAIPIILIAGPLEEEVTFRGYMQHELQQVISPLAAALIIGIGVVIWHAPLLIIGSLGWPMAVCIIAVSVVYAWLYRMGGSVWPVVALHFSVNYFGGELLGSMVTGAYGQFVYQLFFMAFYIAWAAWIVVRFGPSLIGHRSPRLAAA